MKRLTTNVLAASLISLILLYNWKFFNFYSIRPPQNNNFLVLMELSTRNNLLTLPLILVTPYTLFRAFFFFFKGSALTSAKEVYFTPINVGLDNTLSAIHPPTYYYFILTVLVVFVTNKTITLKYATNFSRVLYSIRGNYVYVLSIILSCW